MKSLWIVWFVSRLAETNPTPFDFAEGEPELVSGFNVEYRRGVFPKLANHKLSNHHQRYLKFLSCYQNVILLMIGLWEN